MLLLNSGDVRLRMNYGCIVAKMCSFVNFWAARGNFALSTDFEVTEDAGGAEVTVQHQCF